VLRLKSELATSEGFWMSGRMNQSYLSRVLVAHLQVQFPIQDSRRESSKMSEAACMRSMLLVPVSSTPMMAYDLA